MDRTSNQELLTLGQASERTGLPVKRLRWAVRDGELSAYHFGAWRRVKWSDLQEWIESHKSPPNHTRVQVEERL